MGAVHGGRSARWVQCTMGAVHHGRSAPWAQCTVGAVHHGRSAVRPPAGPRLPGAVNGVQRGCGSRHEYNAQRPPCQPRLVAAWGQGMLPSSPHHRSLCPPPALQTCRSRACDHMHRSSRLLLLFGFAPAPVLHPLVQALRAVGDPERGPLDVPEGLPGPALRAPVPACSEVRGRGVYRWRWEGRAAHALSPLGTGAGHGSAHGRRRATSACTRSQYPNVCALLVDNDSHACFNPTHGLIPCMRRQHLKRML